MKNALKEVFVGFKSLVIGMKITIGQFFKPTITVHYPHETLKIPPRFRGHIELVRDPETGKAKCFACKLCERACPSDCISVEGVKLEGAKRKSVNFYKLDFTKCSLCGSCVEACPEGCIEFSRDYNLAGTGKEEFLMDLFKKLEDEARAAGFHPTPTPTPAPQAAKPEPPKAEAPKTESAKEQPKVEAPKPEAPKPEQPKAAQPPQSEPTKVEAK